MKLTAQETALIEALRAMPTDECWSREIGESALGNGYEYGSDWGTKVWAAFLAFGDSRGEPGECPKCGKPRGRVPTTCIACVEWQRSKWPCSWCHATGFCEHTPCRECKGTGIEPRR